MVRYLYGVFGHLDSHCRLQLFFSRVYEKMKPTFRIKLKLSVNLEAKVFHNIWFEVLYHFEAES